MKLRIYEGKNDLGFLKHVSIFNMKVEPTSDSKEAKSFQTKEIAKSYANMIRIMTKKKLECDIVK